MKERDLATHTTAATVTGKAAVHLTNSSGANTSIFPAAAQSSELHLARVRVKGGPDRRAEGSSIWLVPEGIAAQLELWFC